MKKLLSLLIALILCAALIAAVSVLRHFGL